jgi:uncharacterized membrane protein YeaQ/YmgE (transglycosylase-associated protein family)
MGIISWIIVGFLAGLIARAIMPGKQSMGLLATTLLGMAGSLLGGLIGSLFTGRGIEGFTTGGLLLSIVGAFLVLFIVGLVRRPSARAV